MNDTRFSLAFRSVTEQLTEVIAEKYLIVYSYSYSDKEAVEVVNFEVKDSEINNTLASGYFIASTGQIEFKTTGMLSDFVLVITSVNQGCTDVLSLINKSAE